mmetsp:Transcript_31410/g.73326  ORF Transcript_31410/g.73326 Transcript_31410/m.73326 type:complete len:292 (-) Transcript_31410:949-1824(-)
MESQNTHACCHCKSVDLAPFRGLPFSLCGCNLENCSEGGCLRLLLLLLRLLHLQLRHREAEGLHHLTNALLVRLALDLEEPFSRIVCKCHGVLRHLLPSSAQLLLVVFLLLGLGFPFGNFEKQGLRSRIFLSAHLFQLHPVELTPCSGLHLGVGVHITSKLNAQLLNFLASHFGLRMLLVEGFMHLTAPFIELLSVFLQAILSLLHQLCARLGHSLHMVSLPVPCFSALVHKLAVLLQRVFHKLLLLSRNLDLALVKLVLSRFSTLAKVSLHHLPSFLQPCLDFLPLLLQP